MLTGGNFLLLKLQGLGLEVIPTCDGGYFMTPDALEQEIFEDLQTAGGRIACTALSISKCDGGVSNADLEAAMDRIVASSPLVHLVRSKGQLAELLTEGYLDQLARKAEDLIHAEGHILISNLAPLFNLPLEFTKSFIEARVVGPKGRVMSNVSMRRGILVSDSEDIRLRNKLCELCEEVKEPIPLLSLSRSCGGDEEGMVGLISDSVRDLTQNGKLPGSIRGQEYIPDVYWTLQRTAVDTFFAENGYLHHAKARELQVHKPLNFVRESFPEALDLETAVVSPSMVEWLEASLEGAVVQKSWVEAWSTVPTDLSERDAGRLLGMCRSCCRPTGDPLGVVQLAEVYGVSRGFLGDLIGVFKEDAQAKAAANYVASRSTVDEGQGLHTTEGIVIAGGGRGASCKSKCGKKSSSKGRKGKGGRKQDKEEGPGLPGMEEVQLCIVKWRPELEDHVELVSALAEEILSAVRDVWVVALRNARGEMSKDASVTELEFESAFEEQYSVFRLLCKGIAALDQELAHSTIPERDAPCCHRSEKEMRESEHSVLRHGHTVVVAAAERYLLESRGAQLADLLTSKECSKLGIRYASQDATAGNGAERMPCISQEACRALATILPHDVGHPLAEMWSLIMGGARISVFSDHLENKVLPGCNMMSWRLDKKRERSLVLGVQRDLVQLLSESDSGIEVFNLTLALLFLRLRGAVLLPPRASPSPGLGAEGEVSTGAPSDSVDLSWSFLLLEALRSQVEPRMMEALCSLHEQVGGWCEVVHDAESDCSGGGENKSKRTRQQLRQSGVDVELLVKATEAVRAIGISLAL